MLSACPSIHSAFFCISPTSPSNTLLDCCHTPAAHCPSAFVSLRTARFPLAEGTSSAQFEGAGTPSHDSYPQQPTPTRQTHDLANAANMDTNMEDVKSEPMPMSSVPTTEPTTIPTLDGWIESLMTCKQLAESDVQRLCEKVYATAESFLASASLTVWRG
jgi:hypothetical protein